MITNSVLEAISKFSLLEADTIVTVALSGGADSMALLNVLITLKDRLNIKVKAAHLNHLIRGDEAYRDEEFVKKQCEILNVPLVCQQKDVPKYAKENNLSLELAARKLRYEFLNEISEGVIATAHTASDNLETVIFNLTRGTGIDGLCGSVTLVTAVAFTVAAILYKTASVSILAAALAGACAGYLIWNHYPAKVMMGDTGSMFLGGLVVALAYAINMPIILLLFGFIYVVEAMSDVIQIGSIKIRHKKVFKMAPIHHHFEMCGWNEVKIVRIFTLVNAIACAIGMVLIYFGDNRII